MYTVLLVLVVLTLTGTQLPEGNAFMAAVGGPVMQTCLVIESLPQLPRTTSLTLYIPGAVKFTPRLLEPEIDPFEFPRLPLVTFQFPAGLIDQVILGRESHVEVPELTFNGATEVLVNMTG